jgi:cell cycle checkpoint protein
MEEGGPFTITIEESGVRTTANLVTYTPEIPDDIPFDRADLAFKIIMHPRSLLDALNEVATMGPRKLVIRATNYEPWLLLAGKGGDFGASSYDFSKGRELLESVSIREDWVQSYKFDLIKSASEAMRLAHKLSFRGDRQGVLSLQFIVEVEGVGSNFLEFTFVPFAGYEEEGDDVGDES